MQEPRVLFIASDYKPKPGGRADYIDNLSRGLIDRGVSTTVLAICPEHQQERLKFLRNYAEWVIPFPIHYDQRPRQWLGSKVVSILEISRCLVPEIRPILTKAPWFAGSVGATRRLDKIVDELRPTVVVFGHVDLRLYWCALHLSEREIPYIIIAHESEIYRFGGRVNECVRKGAMIEGAERIAANSRHTKTLVDMWEIPEERIKIVYPPIAKDAIELGPSIERRCGRKDELRVATICRLVKPKGIDIAIRALAILSKEGIPFQYVIAGAGPEREDLELLARSLGVSERIQFRGYVTSDEKWQLLADSDVFVMPSRVDPRMQHEGFGIAFLEAAALGIPGIGSNAGGIPDAVVDGSTGILVPQESPEHLVEALLFCYRNPEKRREMGRLGMERATTQFSPAAVALRFEEQVLRAL
jgi:phosphatidylinositol alpha-1,6-mannosyltransferase